MPEAAQNLVEPALELVSSWGLQVVGAITVLIVGRFVCGGLRRGTRRALEKSSVDATLIPFISSGVHYLALTVVILAVLNLFGIQTASVIAVLGAAGLGAGDRNLLHGSPHPGQCEDRRPELGHLRGHDQELLGQRNPSQRPGHGHLLRRRHRRGEGDDRGGVGETRECWPTRPRWWRSPNGDSPS